MTCTCTRFTFCPLAADLRAPARSLSCREDGLSLIEAVYAALVEHGRAAGVITPETEAETCRAGHPLSGENLRVRQDGKRACRACDRARSRERRRKEARA